MGRGKELAEFGGLLERSRLLTLTGAPGIGKSRLALEGASGLTGRYRDGSRIVELAAVSDPALIPRAMASVLSVQEVPGRTLADAILAHLGKRQLLLLLDNCEHLVSACANLVASLLNGCPQLSIVVTSREPLAITGEHVWQVPPLAVPDLDDALTPEALLDCGAGRMFVERASAVQLGFDLSAEHARPVADIVWRLDGIPLAIELAAARVEMLTPAEIAAGLDHRFDLLTRGSRSDLPRHQTLQAALDWSHDLLGASERALLRRLSVFTGGFCLDACEGICAGGEVGDEEEVFHLLARLVAKSLVLADTANSRGRYRLLETIRAYAGDRLEQSGEAGSSREAHARFYLALAERAEPELTGPSQTEWFERLDTEHDNLRSALKWSLFHGQTEWALRLAGVLILFWRVRCHFSEGRDLLEAVLSASDGEAPGLRAKALWGAGFLTFMAGDPERAAPVLEESLSGFRELGDVQGSARALLILANTKQCLKDPSVLSLLEESAAQARGVGDPWCLAHALAVAGLEYARRGELPAARPLFEECLAVAREAEDKQGLRIGLIGLGSVALGQGDYRTAESALAEAVAMTGELGEQYGEGIALRDLGQVALGRGDYGRARELLDQALTRLEELGEPSAVLGPLLLLARVAHAEGDRPQARLLFDKALASAGGAPPVVALPWMGELAAEDGDPSTARRLFEEARERAGAQGDNASLPQALHGLGHLARVAGDVTRAAALHSEALELQRQMGDAPRIAASLEAVGGLAAAGDRHQHAARLLGAAKALRDRGGYARAPWEASRYEADVAAVRRALSAEELEVAFVQGAELSIEEAVAQASKGRGRRGRPTSGWPSLTETEERVAALVAEGLTNPEIAERLFITPGTVKVHVSHIFTKLGMTGRRQLAREFRNRRPQPSMSGPRSSRDAPNGR